MNQPYKTINFTEQVKLFLLLFFPSDDGKFGVHIFKFVAVKAKGKGKDTDLPK